MTAWTWKFQGKSQSFRHGYEDSLAGIQIEENPYHSRTGQHSDWEDGWVVGDTELYGQTGA